jgi:phosphatidylserine/phosphatidylglycerophosphate/cardiolipin synthase-like enzyme
MTLSKGLIAIVMLVALPVQAEMSVQACFSPAEKCSAHLLREIVAARKELLVAVYAFTNDDLATALIHAKKRGVMVRVIIDREYDGATDRSKGRFLESQKIPVRRLSGVKANTAEKDGGLMHQKFAVIDGSLLFTGSYNWTRAADHLNDENLLMFRNAGALAEEYRKEFFNLWARRS